MVRHKSSNYGKAAVENAEAKNAMLQWTLNSKARILGRDPAKVSTMYHELMTLLLALHSMGTKSQHHAAEQ